MFKVSNIVNIVICIVLGLIPLLYICIYLLNVNLKKNRKKKIIRLVVNTLLIVLTLSCFKIALFSVKELNNKDINNNNTVEKRTEAKNNKTTTTTTTVKTTTTSNTKYKKLSVVLEDDEKVGKTSKGYTIYEKDGITYIDGYLIANKTYSLPKDYNPGKLDSTVSAAAADMFAAAKKEKGYSMWAQSGFRSYETQKNIYDRYVKNDGKANADTYSARPGYSEHQSGLAFDVCATNKPCITSGFNNTDEANWLSENAWKYGFILRYVKDKTDETGYKYESWHFRYVGYDLAKELYNDGDWITMEDYFGFTSKYSD